MLTTDFDVKLKLIIMLVVGLIVLASIIGWLFHRDHHYTRYFTGVLVVMVVQVFILISLFLIHQ
ncbi:hypothetical protein [Levilactobacillus yiduensis]|uniref:hypothetical protein n=1 Tax=Levilactobacillus yiduensis TaxID=2953880 RepID=UPI000EF2E308|nr:hypothetical protein [Levilactobacillus yiduensis]AYM03991.1 hypothetical protein D8911_13800 [Levilactobacillus brevis]